jgi:hypothetical protein
LLQERGHDVSRLKRQVLLRTSLRESAPEPSESPSNCA